jgi:hypothetical protein
VASETPDAGTAARIGEDALERYAMDRLPEAEAARRDRVVFTRTGVTG